MSGRSASSAEAAAAATAPNETAAAAAPDVPTETVTDIATVTLDQTVDHTVTDLFTVRGSIISTELFTVTLSPTGLSSTQATQTAESQTVNQHSPVGAIVGAIIGCLLLLSLGLAAFFIRRRRAQRQFKPFTLGPHTESAITDDGAVRTGPYIMSETVRPFAERPRSSSMNVSINRVEAAAALPNPTKPEQPRTTEFALANIANEMQLLRSQVSQLALERGPNDLPPQNNLEQSAIEWALHTQDTFFF
ncbi:hypothetical protein B0H13DRAFT_2688173 [Mycena leptocephala]|nr:hypothetical protein B0H13DRAFT_2688173 [Mycena leptocephala]